MEDIWNNLWQGDASTKKLTQKNKLLKVMGTRMYHAHELIWSRQR